MQASASNDLKKIKDTVYLWNSLEVHIVPPGTYLMSGAIDYKINSSLSPVAAAKGLPQVTAPGSVNLSAVLYRQFVKETYWRSASYVDKTSKQNVCSAVHVASGRCVSLREQQYTTREKISDAGWTEGTNMKDVQSIKLQVQISDVYAPVAFIIQPGHIMLSDRFHLPPRCKL